MMIKKSFSLISQISRRILFNMSSQSDNQLTQKQKGYRMPAKKELIPYRTEHPLRLHNYRILLFANKQSLYTPALLQTGYGIIFLVFIGLIRSNPWYLTFPASLPIMLGLQIYALYKWIQHKKHYKYMIERVYLYQANQIEFVFSNKLRRKFKDIEAFHHFLEPSQVVKPKQGANDQIEWTQKGFPFPEKAILKKNSQTGEIQYVPPAKPLWYGWTKYCENFTPYIFPKQYQYANWQLLINLFNGRHIDFENSINTPYEVPQGEDYPSLEKQLNWIKEDMMLNKRSSEESTRAIKSDQTAQINS